MGNFVHEVFGFDWWNYEWIPMHFTKFTSVPTSAGFSLIITAFMSVVFPKVMETVSRGDSNFIKWVGLVLFVLMFLDFAVSAAEMYKSRSLNCLWRYTFGQGLEIKRPLTLAKFRIV